MYNLLSVLSVLIIISTVPIVSAEVMRGESIVPDWVKNTAGWFASEQIDDSAFLQGIQYLIKEGIMIVEIPTEIDSESTEEVPGWVKNTVGWWAEDKIHDTTFVSGIQYLISKGIMVVEQEVEVEESVEEVVFFARVNAILKRVAPGAFAFVVPVEGSRRVASVVLSTIDSVVVKPTRYVGVLEYFSKTRVCGRHSAKNPLTK